jgi:regulator of cell morphogenesis and NO signaling
MISTETHTLKEIVRHDFRAAAVFERYSLDFCCNGGVTIEQACATRHLDAAPILAELTNLSHSPVPPDTRFTQWEADALIEHIVNVHHSYVRNAIPVLLTHTAKVARVHGERHPEVITIAERFSSVAEELSHHMMKEERVLFPYIDALVKAVREGQQPPVTHFGTAANPIRMMEAEHAAAGDTLYTIRSLSDNYTPPADACTTYQVTYQELRQFETDLHTHVHLENNILFPRAIALESGAPLSIQHAS